MNDTTFDTPADKKARFAAAKAAIDKTLRESESDDYTPSREELIAAVHNVKLWLIRNGAIDQAVVLRDVIDAIREMVRKS